MGEQKRKQDSKSNFIFGKKNYKWMFIGLGFITLGFILMSGLSLPEQHQVHRHRTESYSSAHRRYNDPRIGTVKGRRR